VSSAAFDLKFLSPIRGNFRRNFKSAALEPHDFAVRKEMPLVARHPPRPPHPASRS